MNDINIETGKITIGKLIERDGNTCYICGIRTSTEGGCYDPKYPNIEHVHPRSLGGEDAWYNVKVACRDCNVRKNNMPLEEFLKRKNIKREIKVTLKDNHDNVRGEVAKRFEDEINSLKKAVKSDELRIERLQEENNKLKKELEKYKNIYIYDGIIEVDNKRFTTLKCTFKNKIVKYISFSVGYEKVIEYFKNSTEDDMNNMKYEVEKDYGQGLIKVEIDDGDILWKQDSTPKKLKGFFSKILK